MRFRVTRQVLSAEIDEDTFAKLIKNETPEQSLAFIELMESYGASNVEYDAMFGAQIVFTVDWEGDWDEHMQKMQSIRDTVQAYLLEVVQ